MKKLLLNLAAVLFMALMSGTMYAQDIIITTKGIKIEAKVLEIGLETVKYKEFDNLNGPDYIIRKSEIASIFYPESGKVEVFEQEKASPATSPNVTNPNVDNPNKDSYNESGDYQYFKSLDDRDMADFLEKNDFESFEIFRKGKHLKRAGIGLFAPGIVLSVTGLTLTIVYSFETNSNGNFYNVEDYAAYSIGVSFLTIGQVMVVASIPLQAVGGKFKQKGKDNYEQKFFSNQKAYSPSFHLNIYSNGLGITMKF